MIKILLVSDGGAFDLSEQGVDDVGGVLGAVEAQLDQFK